MTKEMCVILRVARTVFYIFVTLALYITCIIGFKLYTFGFIWLCIDELQLAFLLLTSKYGFLLLTSKNATQW